MNIQLAIAQLDQLPANIVARSVNSVAYPLRVAMLLEAAKDTPDLSVVATARKLDSKLAELAPGAMYTLESTALFVFGDRDAKPEAELRAQDERDGLALLIRDVAAGFEPMPETLAQREEAKKRVVAKRAEKRAARKQLAFQRAVDAVQFCETVELGMDKARYDEAALSEDTLVELRSKLINAGAQAWRALKRSEARIPAYDELAMTRIAENLAGVRKYLDFFGVTPEKIAECDDERMERITSQMAALAARPVPTVDSPPEDTTPAAKRQRSVVRTQRAEGLSSADMKAAASTRQ